MFSYCITLTGLGCLCFWKKNNFTIHLNTNDTYITLAEPYSLCCKGDAAAQVFGFPLMTFMGDNDVVDTHMNEYAKDETVSLGFEEY